MHGTVDRNSGMNGIFVNSEQLEPVGIPRGLSIAMSAAAFRVAGAPGDPSLGAALPPVVACDDRGGGGSAASFCLFKAGWVASRNGSREMTVAVAISFPKAMARRASMC